MSNSLNIFQKIILRQIPADIIYENDLVMVFKDIMPQAPIHLIVVPKADIENVLGADSVTMGVLFEAVKVVAKQLELVKTGFRVVINTGSDGGQSVPHLHLHVLGGRELKWAPG